LAQIGFLRYNTYNVNKQEQVMFTVIRVYSMKEEEMIAVIADGKLVRRFYNISEFTVADIMQVAGADVVIGSAISRTEFKRQYKTV
jgi:hypothetical protein